MKRALLLFLLLAALLSIAATSAFYILDSDGDRLPFGTAGTLTLPGNLSGTPNNVTLTIDHADLQYSGVQPHSAIDAHLAAPGIHFTESSINHQNITGSGTNTHAQIDTQLSTLGSHTADSTLHFTQAQIDHSALIGASGFANHSAIDAQLAALESHTADSTLHFTQAQIDHSALIGASGYANHSAIDAHMGDLDIHAPIFDNVSTTGATLWSSDYTKSYIDATGGSGFVLSVTDNTTTASPVNALTFDPAGFTVTDNGSGSATITNLGGTGGTGGGWITADTTIYVSESGDDLTGDGSIITPFATPQKALASIGENLISSVATVTIQLQAGHYLMSEDLLITHASSNRISIKGDTYSRSLTGIVSGSGTSGNYDVTLSLNDTAGIQVGDYVLIKQTSGGTNHWYIQGFHKITDIISGSQIKIKSTHRSGYGSGAVIGSVTILRSVLDFSVSGLNGVYLEYTALKDITNLAIIGKRYGILLNNNSALLLKDSGITALGDGVNGYGIGALNGSALSGTGFAISGALNYGINASQSASLNIDKVVVSGCQTGIIARMSFGTYGWTLSENILTGNSTALEAQLCSGVRVMATYKGNSTNNTVYSGAQIDSSGSVF